MNRACYVAMPLYLCGFLVLGASFQKKLSVGALVMGWGLAEVAVMINTVAVCTSPPLTFIFLYSPAAWFMIINQLRHRCVLQRLLPATQG